MVYNTICNCINLQKASNNLTNINLKVTQFSNLRNIKKLGKINISDLSYLLTLDRITKLRNITKFIEMNLVSYKYKNNNKNKKLTTVGKNKLR